VTRPLGYHLPVLRVSRVVADTDAEGPGRRFAVWTQGCPLRCPGCCNPEMFGEDGGEALDVGALAGRVLATPGIEGLTLLGGEPFAQAGACALLAGAARGGGLSVAVFSGYTLAELEQAPDPAVASLLAATDLLFAGRFERDRPERRRRWIGSANQTIHFLSSRYREDDPRFFEPNTVEIRLAPGSLTVNGWPAAAAALRPRRGGAR
jgi:anaerobic ribonucleoside-triphosphate reductase activating protein